MQITCRRTATRTTVSIDMYGYTFRDGYGEVWVAGDFNAWTMDRRPDLKFGYPAAIGANILLPLSFEIPRPVDSVTIKLYRAEPGRGGALAWIEPGDDPHGPYAGCASCFVRNQMGSLDVVVPVPPPAGRRPKG